MKKVFASHSEVAHIWAQRVQSEGRASAMNFQGDTIYSYGKHFPIAKFQDTPDGDTVVLFTYRGYSISTAKHISHTRRAISHYDVVYCHTPGDSVESNLHEEKAEIDRLLQLIAATKHKVRIGNLSTEILHVAGRAKKYAAVMGVAAPAWASIPEDIRELAARRMTERAEEEEKLRVAREAQAAKRLAEAAERLEAWVTDTTIYAGGFYGLPTKLRVKGDEIQTSHGATIPVEHAVRIWPLLHKAHESGQPVVARPDHTLHLGYYKFNSFENDILTVGCHQIPYSEIERMAEQLSLLEAA